MKSEQELTARHQHARLIKETVQDELLQYPGVTGIGVAYKTIRGQATDDWAITVVVKRKTNKVAKSEQIPQEIQELPTDVIEGHLGERGEPQQLQDDEPAALVDKNSYNPLVGGISIGLNRMHNGKIPFGTLGLIVQDLHSTQQFILTNEHVVTLGNQAPNPAHTMTQPSKEDNLQAPIVATVGNRFFRGNVPVDNPTYGVDCAAPLITLPAQQAVLGYIQQIGNITGAGLVQPGDLNNTVYRIRGRTTGLWTARISSMTFQAQDGIADVLRNQLLLTPIDKSPAQGDSGSVVVNQYNQVVGLLWGVGTKLVVASPIGPVLQTLNVQIVPGNYHPPSLA